MQNWQEEPNGILKEIHESEDKECILYSRSEHKVSLQSCLSCPEVQNEGVKTLLFYS